MKRYTTILILFLFCFSVYGQVPEGFNYQAVIRDVAGNVIPDADVSLKISILQDSESGSIVYSEVHTTTTNSFGLVNLVIGKGKPESGIFSPGGWGLHKHFIKVEMDPAGGDSFIHLSTTQLLAVPYAFHANTVENDAVDDADPDPVNEIQDLSLDGSMLSLSKGGGSVSLPYSTPWQQIASDIFFNTGKVGIGTNTPVFDIDIRNQSSAAYARISSLTDNAGLFVERLEPDDTSSVVYKTGELNTFYTGLLGSNSFKISSENQKLKGLEVRSTGDVALSDHLFMANGKKISIGDETPSNNINILTPNPGISLKSYQDAGKTGNAFIILDKINTNKSAYMMFRNNGVSKFYAGLLKNDNYRISTSNTSLQGIEVEDDGDVNISDELHSSRTGEANMLPIAYGNISIGGYIESGSGNFRASRTGLGQYEILIEGEDIDYWYYTMCVTLHQNIGFVWAGSGGASMMVFTYNKDGESANRDFSFVVYKE
jgi:hypothetical protein